MAFLRQHDASREFNGSLSESAATSTTQDPARGRELLRYAADLMSSFDAGFSAEYLTGSRPEGTLRWTTFDVLRGTDKFILRHGDNRVGEEVDVDSMLATPDGAHSLSVHFGMGMTWAEACRVEYIDRSRGVSCRTFDRDTYQLVKEFLDELADRARRKTGAA